MRKIECFDNMDNNRYVPGHGDVEKIEEHPAAGEGDRWYYDVFFKGGKMVRHFNPKNVLFGEEVALPF